MRASKKRPPPRESSATTASPVRIGVWATAVLAGMGWAWAFALLAVREHEVVTYSVIASAPPAWGFLALDTPRLLLAIALGAAWAWRCARAERAFAPPTRWLLAAYLIPALDLVRLAGESIPATFLEPLALIVITTGAVRAFLGAAENFPKLSPRACQGVVWGIAAAAGMWWYWQNCEAYDNYLLGYHDFGHFAHRVVNTWEGRGFLRETPSLPAYWDHYNPGLALLAPLWGLWPDARLFLLLQAVCLAGSAPIVFAAAWRAGAESTAAALWTAAYLLFPVTGQLNLGYSYGWHPDSQALPLLFAALAFALERRFLAAAVAAGLACTFVESIPVVLAFLAFTLAGQAWAGGQWASPLARRAPWWGWFLAWGAFTLYFLLVFRFAAFSHYQVNRFVNLGETPGEVLLSPLLRPGEFWGQVLRAESAWFLLCLLTPLGWRTMLRGWPTLLALAPPLMVLLAWKHQPAIGLSFQYLTALLPIMLLAAWHGALAPHFARAASDLQSEPEPSKVDRRLHAAAVVAIAGCAVASVFLGAWPWSSPTIPLVAMQSYPAADALSAEGPSWRNPRQAGSPGHRLLEDCVRQVGADPGAAVLASGRVAAHLIHLRRLESVGQALEFRWQALAEEAGPGKSPIEVFDWVLLDTQEQFQQSPELMEQAIREARRVGYRTVRNEDGVVLLARPDP